MCRKNIDFKNQLRKIVEKKDNLSFEKIKIFLRPFIDPIKLLKTQIEKDIEVILFCLHLILKRYKTLKMDYFLNIVNKYFLIKTFLKILNNKRKSNFKNLQ